MRICLATDARAQALAEAAKAYFARKGGRKGAWVDLAAETATVSVFDAAVALMARRCGGPVAFRNLLRDPAALAAKLSRAPAPQQVTTLQGLSEASWAPQSFVFVCENETHLYATWFLLVFFTVS